MAEFPDLYALVLRLHTERGGPLPEVQGHQAQALFFELVRQIDPELANRLHADAPSKPFTVAMLAPTNDERRTTNDRTQSRGAAQRSSLELRVTLMDAALFAPFTQALLRQAARPAMRLGSASLALGDVCGTPDSHPWAGYASFANLAATCAPAPFVALEFAAPTAFGQGTRADGRPRLGLLPTPEAVFGSIARRWNELAPTALRLDEAAVEAAARETLLARYHAESRTFQLGRNTQKGFVGACIYELPPEPTQARLIALLAEAVFFLGVGMKTGRGMGQCRKMDEGRRTTDEGRRATTNDL